MDERTRLWEYVETWHRACADFVDLARSLTDDEAALATDLPGWDVHACVAHTAHLESALAGMPQPPAEVPEGLEHVRGPMGAFTEQGVLARRDRSLAELAEETETAVARRWAALQADPPTDGSAPPAMAFAGLPWDTETLLRNRPLDVWMHEQDIRRATGRPGGFDAPAAAHTIGYLAGALPVVVGKRVAPPVGTCVAVAVPEAGIAGAVSIGEDGRARPSDDDPDVRITLSAESFVLLAGGRRRPEDVPAKIEGDEELGRRVLASMAVTP
ncbi:MAG TPA: maleylpyruvate isomerase family mycothiol-dependent enzyme [Marmoricola sp.]|nr:maleylpyruvate isomerase family mycothiol-dependent enzyme [Marmoricola sp.]